MKWSSWCAAAVVFVGLVAACSDDEGAPGPGGTGTGTSSSGQLELAVAGCEKDGDCKSGVCFVDRQKFCSLKCTTENASTVCVAPLSGSCNNKGFCKKD